MAEERINLLTGEPIKYKEDPGGGVNLLPDLANTTPDPERPDYKPYIEDIGNSFMAGLAQTWENLARTPAAVYDGAALPQNFLVKALGRDDLQVKSPEWLMDNPVAEYYESQADLFRERISPKKTFEEAMTTGDWSGMGRSISLSVIENAPTQIGLIATYLAGTPATGLTGMGMMTMADSLKEGRDKGMDPAMNAYNSLTKGFIEAGFEQLGTMGLLKGWSTTLTKSFGTKATKEVMGDVFKAIFYTALGEGNEEFWTSLGQDFSDYVTGANPGAMKGCIARALEAATVGAASGAGMTGPVAVRTGAQSAAINKMQDEIYKAKEILEAETKPGFIPPTAEEVQKRGLAAEEFPEIAAEKLGTPEVTRVDATTEDFELHPERMEGLKQNVVSFRTPEGKIIQAKVGDKINGREILNHADLAIAMSQETEVKEWEPGFINIQGNFVQIGPEPTTVKPMPKPTLKENLQERLAELQDNEAKRAYLKDSLVMVEEARKEFKGRIMKYKDGYLKEELANLPRAYVTTKQGITPDEAMQELRDQGQDIRSESDLVDYLQNLEARRAEIQDEIDKLKPKKIVKTEATRIKERLADIKRGIREGRVQTLKEVKAVQNELIDMMKILDPKDRAKFIKTLKNVQTQQQLEKVIGDIGVRMARVYEQTKKANIKEQIKKQLDKTKKVRKGDRKVGKYDYESNMFFKDMRRINKLTQVNAFSELEAMPEENLTEMQKIKKRLLSLKVNGAQASLVIYERVLADIKMLKEYGEAAKTDEDFNKRVEQGERIDTFLEGADKVSGGKTPILSRLKRAYLKGVGSTYSLLNAVFGKKIADVYDPEIYEADKAAAIHERTQRITERTKEIYGQKNILRLFERWSKETYKVTEQTERGAVKELTKAQLIDIYNSMKNDQTRESYVEHYGEEQLDSLMANLSEQDMEFADMLQEEVQRDRDLINEKSIEIYGEDMGYVDNYWPRTSEYVKSVFDDQRISSSTPRSVRERAKGKTIPEPQDAWRVAQRAIAEAEYVRYIGDAHDRLQRIIRDREVKHTVKTKFDKDVYQALQNQIDDIGLHAQMQTVDAISRGFQKVLNQWVKAKIFSPTIFLRQLGSTSNYVEQMPAKKWVKGFREGLRHPKQTFDYMWKGAKYLPARYHRGYKEALTNALDDAKKMSANQDSWSRGISAMVRAGDMTAIVFGGYSYVKYLQTKEGGNLSEEAAFKQFVKVTLKSQQSPFVSGTTRWQRSGGATGLLTSFKNTSHQYARKLADATIQYKNGEISLGQYSKIMTIYGIIQPTIYVALKYPWVMGLGAIGAAIRGEEQDWEVDELVQDILVSIVTSPVNFLPFVKGIVNFAARKMTGKKAYNVLSLPMISDVENALKKGFKKEKTFGDWVEIVGTPLEAGAAIPVLSLKRIYDYLMGTKGKDSGVKLGQIK